MRTDLDQERIEAVHTSMWVAAPYYESEMIDAEMQFPLSKGLLKEAIRTSANIIPDFFDELLPTTPQVSDYYAICVAIPGCYRCTAQLWHWMPEQLVELFSPSTPTPH